MKVHELIKKYKVRELLFMKDKLILEKIIKHINELKEFISGYDIEGFKSDRKTINACVFSLSQIGELATKVSDEIIMKYPRNRVERFEIIKKSNST